MQNILSRVWRWQNLNLGLLLLRFAVGAVFVWHGYLKLFGSAETVTRTIAFFDSIGLPAVMVTLVGIIELLGGALLVFGLWTRVAGLLLAVDMVFAIYLAKYRAGFVGGYEFDLVLFAAGALFALYGAGDWSFDRLFSKQEPQNPSVQQI